MPLLDVSEVLDDPDFADTVNVTRKTATVDTHGRANFVTSVYPNVVAVVVAASKAELVRTPEGEMTAGDIMVVTKFNLSSGDGAETADIVNWNGRNYTVVQTDDYSRYGVGFVSATCKQLQLNG